MNDRDLILRRIRGAVADLAAGPDVVPSRTYRRTGAESREARAEQLVARLVEYRAWAERIHAREVRNSIAAACRRRSVESLVVPEDIPQDWVPDGINILRDGTHGRQSDIALDQSGGVLTGCALAIAQTGTIVLNGGATQGRRALTLLPDYHLCVVREDQIVDLVPEAFDALAAHNTAQLPPLTFVSGPSATSDIELNRVEGVHGPRILDVFVIR